MSPIRVPTITRVRWLLVAVSVSIGLLACAVGSDAGGAMASGRGGTIAFLRLTSGTTFGGRVFTIRPDGNGLRAVTPAGTTVVAYRWSPDGRSIAYIDKYLSLWIVRRDGSERRLLLSHVRLSVDGLSWSPDGTELVIASPGVNVNSNRAQCESALYVVSDRGGQPRSLHMDGGCDVAWSPRGDVIAYSRGGEIFVVRADGTGSHEVAKDGGPLWSADGSQLAFGTTIARGRCCTLGDRYDAFGVVNADGTSFRVVTTHAYTEYAVAWSPVGRRILYGRADRAGIDSIDPDSQGNRRITRDAPPQAGWGALAWSPTGGSIVYTTGPATNTDLYAIGIDGRDRVRLTNSPQSDIDPSWVTA